MLVSTLGFGPQGSFPPSKSRFGSVSFSLAPGGGTVRSLSARSGVSAVRCSSRLSVIEVRLKMVIRLWSVQPVRSFGRFDEETLSTLPGLLWPEGLFVRPCWSRWTRGWLIEFAGVAGGRCAVAWWRDFCVWRGYPLGDRSAWVSFCWAARWLLATVVILLLLLVWPYTSHEARLCYALCGWLHTRGAAG